MTGASLKASLVENCLFYYMSNVLNFLKEKWWEVVTI